MNFPQQTPWYSGVMGQNQQPQMQAFNAGQWAYNYPYSPFPPGTQDKGVLAIAAQTDNATGAEDAKQCQVTPTELAQTLEDIKEILSGLKQSIAGLEVTATEAKVDVDGIAVRLEAIETSQDLILSVVDRVKETIIEVCNGFGTLRNKLREWSEGLAESLKAVRKRQMC